MRLEIARYARGGKEPLVEPRRLEMTEAALQAAFTEAQIDRLRAGKRVVLENRGRDGRSLHDVGFRKAK